VEIPARGPLMKHAQGTWVSPAGILRGLACEVGALGVQPGDPPSHWLVSQERLTIHMHEALCSQETRPHRHRASVSSATAACVLVGGMTLAVPGAKGFVALPLAQRAVIRSGSSCRLSDVPIAKPLGFVPRAGDRRRNLHGTFPRMPRTQYSPGHGRQTERVAVSHPRKWDTR
jgi:hypothetical protein